MPRMRTMPKANSELLTAPEVAKLLRVSRRHVYNMMDDGTLPSIRLKRSRRIHRSHVEKILADAAATAS